MSANRASAGRICDSLAVSLQQPQQPPAVFFGQFQQGFSQALQIGLC